MEMLHYVRLHIRCGTEYPRFVHRRKMLMAANFFSNADGAHSPVSHSPVGDALDIWLREQPAVDCNSASGTYPNHTIFHLFCIIVFLYCDE